MRRRTGLVGSIVLLGASLVAVAGVSAPPARADYTERWCGTPLVTPCIQSFTINGVAQTSSSPTGLVLDGPQTFTGYREVNLELEGVAPALSDDLVVVVNTGKTFDPQRMLGTIRLADVDRGTDASGNHLIRIAGKPVRWALGCNFDVWPWVCPTTASSDAVRFGGDIAQLTDPTDTSIGMYVGTNAYYNGIFFEEQPDGSHALTTDIAAPHYYADGSTVITGSIRFRVSYDLMRTDMGIPNPETLTSTSLAGAVKTPTGAPAAGKFVTWHDPDGGGFFIEASGFTFSRKQLLVDAARITPTRPALARTVRKTARRGVLVHTRALPRGARVTSYAAYCRSASGHVVRASGAAGSSVVVVTGLRRGKAYSCKVAANSKAGRGAWSAPRTLRARP